MTARESLEGCRDSAGGSAACDTEQKPNVYTSGVGGVVDLDPCEHDWRVNPVVCTTTETGDFELWMCLKCRTTKVGPRLGSRPQPDPKVRIGPFDPETWERRS